MGRFSDPTDWDDYYEQYCKYCIHDAEDCPIMVLHEVWEKEFLHIDEQDRFDKKWALNLLIPEKVGINRRCRMFLDAKTVIDD